MILRAKMIHQGAATSALRRDPHALHHTNASWQEVNRVSHPLVMTIVVMMIVMVRESPP
jgi:hypothetical protein